MRRALVIALLAAATLLPSPAAAQLSGPVYYAYVVPWQWQVTERATAGEQTADVPANYWRLKYWPAVGFLDMRSLPQRSCNPAQRLCVATGWAIALYDRPLPAAPDAFFLTTWENNRSGTVDLINNQDAAFLLFGLPDAFKADTLDGIVKEIYTLHSDPAGLTAPKPITPNKHRVIKVDIGPVRLFTDRVSTGSEAWQKFTERLQLDYERILETQGKEVALKRAGFWENKWGMDLRSPEQVSRDGPALEPQTAFSDDFDCADSDVMGCDLTWTEVLADWDIESNQATKTLNSDGTARAEHSVSGDDLYAQVTCDNMLDFDFCGVAARFDAAADTMYYYRLDNDGASHNIYSRVNGTSTLLTNGGDDYCGGTCPTPRTIRIEVVGEDIEVFMDGVSKLTYNDPGGITGNDMCGLYGFDTSINYNDFTCEDLGGAPPSARRIFITHS